MSPIILQTFTALTSLLVFASIVGWLLAFRVTDGVHLETVQNLNTRIKSWWIMVAVFGFAILIGPIVTILLFATISFFSLQEYQSSTPVRRSEHEAIGVAFYVFIPLQYLFLSQHWVSLMESFIPVFAPLAIPAVMAIRGDTDEFLVRSSRMVYGVLVTVFGISHAPAILMLDLPANQGALALLFLITVCQLSDVLQYVFGKLLGRRSIAPTVSPSKTLEGLILGGLGAIFVGAGLWRLTPFSPIGAAAASLAIVTFGFLGGLVLSAVKRSLGAKDWGTMIKGHGGALDRVDSLAFAAPLFYHILQHFHGA